MSNREEGPPEGTGYSTPGQDRIIESSSPVVPSPSKTSEERLQTPDARLESIGETPADANPALVETVGQERGELSTADMLRAREASEEQQLRVEEAHMYADQRPGAMPMEWEQHDSGRPTWPDDRTNPPIEYVDAPHGEEPFLQGTNISLNAPASVGRIDAEMDKKRAQAAAGESRSGLAPIRDSVRDTGFNYEEREMERPVEQSDLDRMGIDMPNLPPGDEDER